MLNDRLIEARNKNGLRQWEVAEKLGITEAAYCLYETGKRSPNVIAIKKLAKIFGVTGDFLLETGFDNIGKLSTSEEKLISLFSAMNDEGKEKLLEQAEMLSERHKKTLLVSTGTEE